MGALSAIATPLLAAVAQTVRPACAYERRAPEDSALHRAVRQGWPEVQAAIREQTGGKLPDYLHKAVKAYLACGQLDGLPPVGKCRDPRHRRDSRRINPRLHLPRPSPRAWIPHAQISC